MLTRALRFLHRFHARRTAGLLAVLSVSLMAGVALAQDTGNTSTAPTPPGAPGPPVTATTSVDALHVSIDADDDSVDDGDSLSYRIVVRNRGSQPVSPARLVVKLHEDFDLESITDGGQKQTTDSGGRTLVFDLGSLEPGEEIAFSIHGEFDDCGGDEDIEIDTDIEVRTPGGEKGASDSVDGDCEDEQRKRRDNDDNDDNETAPPPPPPIP